MATSLGTRLIKNSLVSSDWKSNRSLGLIFTTPINSDTIDNTTVAVKRYLIFIVIPGRFILARNPFSSENDYHYSRFPL
ncbi:hypothetical protein D3C79_877050 [compost metagenome]